MRCKSFIFLLLFSFSAFSQRTFNVQGSAVIRVEDEISQKETRKIAEFEARKNAMENNSNFYHQISQSENRKISIENGKESSSFKYKSNDFISGQWIEDKKGYPKFQRIDKNNTTWIKATVAGKARVNKDFDFKLNHEPLSCADVGCVTKSFKHDQKFYFFFQSPEKGYLSIYLDDDNQALKLLPSNEMPYIEIKAGQKYIFFDSDTEEQRGVYLTTEDSETNKLHLIFSKSSFSQPQLLFDNINPGSVDSDDFDNWISRLKSNDEIYYRLFEIEISK
jgi:hypothetical protein